MTKIAIIVPVYKHSGLLPETIETALQQQTHLDFAIILVNDGCPFEETDIVCRQYAMTNPNKILYIYKPNGGLSSARNAGINFALQTFPDLDAIYLMDADNRIGSFLLQKSYDVLFSSPENVGWAYPDIDKFGIEEFSDMSGKYNLIEHLMVNISEAGSMVKREVFDKGVRFDENMKLGYEDWEFWLQCIESGYQGIYVPYSSFKYRQRGESMLKDSERHHSEIMAYILNKHKKLFNYENILRLEQDTFSRYALYLQGNHSFLYTTDLSQKSTEITYKEFSDSLMRNDVKPEFGEVPGYSIFTSDQFVKFLRGQGLFQGVLWHLQQMLDRVDLACLSIESVLGDVTELSMTLTSSPVPSQSVLVMCRTDLISGCMKSKELNWIESIIGSFPEPSFSQLVLRIVSPYMMPKPINPAILLVSLVQMLFNDFKTVSRLPVKLSYLHEERKWLTRSDEFCKRMYGYKHLFPIMPFNGERNLNIAILLPIADFGGVEKVAFNYAIELKNVGMQLHLFVVSPNSKVVIQPQFENVFTTITFFRDSALNNYQPSSELGGDYMGSALSQWHRTGQVDNAIGMLMGMNAIINFNVSQFHSIMSKLRKFGIKTYSSQHLVDRSWYNQPIGTPHEFLAYEHVYDGVLVISQQLRSWFLAQGVPNEKLIYMPNAASYPIDNQERQYILEDRKKRKNRKLRVLYIGRFDRQKGMDRLAKIILRTDNKIEVEWRIVGKEILGDDDGAMDIFTPYLHPVAMSSEALNEHFAWADVMIMVSRFEGVPLTILEAGRLGCVTLATNVGAIEEAFVDGVTGYLFNSDQDEKTLVEQICERLTELSTNKRLLRKLTEGAAEYYGNITWEKSVAPLINKLLVLER